MEGAEDLEVQAPKDSPVLSMYSSIKPGGEVNLVIQSISWFGPATKPSRDIVKPQYTFPVVVGGSGDC